MHLNRHGVIVHYHAFSGTAAEITAAVVIRGGAIVVARIGSSASRNLEFVTDAVAVRIRQAVAIAIVASIRTVSIAITSTVSDAVAAANAALIKHIAVAVTRTFSNAFASTNAALI